MVGSVPPRRAPAIAVDPSSSGARLRHARELRRATTSGGNARLRRMSLASVRGPGGITRLVGRSTSSRSTTGPCDLATLTRRDPEREIETMLRAAGR